MQDSVHIQLWDTWKVQDVMAFCHDYMKDLKHNVKKQCMQEDQATSKTF